MKISVTANNRTELSFPSLIVDLSLFFSLIHNLGLANSISTADQQNKKKRARKEPFTIKFDSEVDFTTNFSKGRVCSHIFCTFERGFIKALFVRTRRN